MTLATFNPMTPITVVVALAAVIWSSWVVSVTVPTIIIVCAVFTVLCSMLVAVVSEIKSVKNRLDLFTLSHVQFRIVEVAIKSVDHPRYRIERRIQLPIGWGIWVAVSEHNDQLWAMNVFTYHISGTKDRLGELRERVGQRKVVRTIASYNTTKEEG